MWTSNKTGSRTIVARQSDWSDVSLSFDDRQRLQKATVLHLDGTGDRLAVEAAQIVKSAGGRVFLDAGSPKKATRDLIALADVVSFPERFSRQFFDDTNVEVAASKILQLGAGAAICTQGEVGAVVFTNGSITRIPAFVVDPIDSTGAGDVFCGGVIAGMLDGRAFEDAVRFGSAAAALKCEAIGNRDALPTKDRITSVIASKE